MKKCIKQSTPLGRLRTIEIVSNQIDHQLQGAAFKTKETTDYHRKQILERHLELAYFCYPLLAFFVQCWVSVENVSKSTFEMCYYCH